METYVEEDHGNIENLNVNQIMSLVGNTYQRIDIRAILARPKEKPDTEWTCIFLKVRMTKENQNGLDDNQRNSTRLGNINKPFFTIEFMNRSIEDLYSILGDITSGHITFGDISANLPSTRCKDILSNISTVSDMYTSNDERAGNIHIMIFTTMELSIAGQIQKLGLTADQIGVKVSELHTWLNTPVLDDGQINNVVLLFPIYCRQITLPRTERNDAIAKYEIHSALLDKCSAKLIDSRGDILKIIQSDYFKRTQKTLNDTTLVSLPPVDKPILMERPLKIQVWHNDLGLIREDNVDVSYLLETPFNEDGSVKEAGPYHVLVGSKVARPWNRNWAYEINLTRDQVLQNFIIPFKKNNKKIVCSGEVFETTEVSRLRVYYTTDNLAGGAAGRKDQLRLDGIINQNGIDVTREFLEEGEKFGTGKQFARNSKQVFIVHGHDEGVKYELARIIDREFHLKSIILHEEPDKGRTIIEKLEGISELPGFAFILLTPDDLGAELVPGENIGKFNDPQMRPDKQKTQFESRARQNVVFEMGFFIGLLGRDRVCCLYKEGVALPSDISGVLYKRFKENISEIIWEMRKELKAAGYAV